MGVEQSERLTDVEAFWNFCLVRADLFKYFVAADPVWDGQFLRVTKDFLLRKDAMLVLETLILCLCTWSDWSETR